MCFTFDTNCFNCEGEFRSCLDLVFSENHKLLIGALDNLDIGYLIKKFKFACEMYTRKKVYGTIEPPLFIDELLVMAKSKFKDNQTIKAYTGILELFRTKDISKLDELKKLVLELCKQNNITYKLDLIAQLINALPPLKVASNIILSYTNSLRTKIFCWNMGTFPLIILTML